MDNRVPQQAPQRAPEQAPEGDTEDTNVNVDTDLEPLGDQQAEGALTQIAERSSAALQQTAIEQVLDGGQIEPGVIEAVASEMGVSTDAIDAVVHGGIRPAMEQQAMAAVGEALGTTNADIIQAPRHDERRHHSGRTGLVVCRACRCHGRCDQITTDEAHH